MTMSHRTLTAWARELADRHLVTLALVGGALVWFIAASLEKVL